MSVRSKVIEAIQQIAREQHVALPALSDDLSLHETGFDSLAFAILVARLETRPASTHSPFPRTQRSPPRWAISCGPTKMSPREIFALRDHLGAG